MANLQLATAAAFVALQDLNVHQHCWRRKRRMLLYCKSRGDRQASSAAAAACRTGNTAAMLTLQQHSTPHLLRCRPAAASALGCPAAETKQQQQQHKDRRSRGLHCVCFPPRSTSSGACGVQYTCSSAGLCWPFCGLAQMLSVPCHRPLHTGCMYLAKYKVLLTSTNCSL